MAKLKQYRLMFVVAFLLGACFVALAVRLVELQVFRHESLRAQSRAQTTYSFNREPRRGEIRDSRGNLLATSLFVKTVCANPQLVSNRMAEVVKVLAPLLKTNEAFLAQRLQPRIVRTNERGALVFSESSVLKRKVRQEEWAQITNAIGRLTFGYEREKLGRALTSAEKEKLSELRTRMIFAEPQEDQLRLYPRQSLAAHVLGFLDEDGRGASGIERVFDKDMTGVRGWRESGKNSRNMEQVEFRASDIEPQAGLNVVLTIDEQVQNIVESELAEAMIQHTPVSASCVVVRPKTGRILAMASLPAFDPAQPGKSNLANLNNRVIADVAEPGSTFKIVVVAGALEENLISLEDRFDCEMGKFVFAGQTLHDAGHHFGVLSVEDIVAKSSNIGAAKIGIKLGPERLYSYIRAFGFGAATGIDLRGEVNGISYPPAKWSKLSISRIPMGQGIATTPLQMTMAMCAIANGGKLMRPMMVDHLEDEQRNVRRRFEPQIIRQVISETTSRRMVTALKAVVATNGTALGAKLDYFTVAGKTGTAQKSEGGRYVEGKYFSSFIGFFPADDPELCIAVMLDDPKNGYYGGKIVAPIFKDIAERAANYLNIHPDTAPEAKLEIAERSARNATRNTN
ncbi:MAG: penicillin-binding protein 2 [Verrucomicrobia bacterium]|nr:penicillin-binding protein 2 [Verrucomicrobiota bacterium]